MFSIDNTNFHSWIQINTANNRLSINAYTCVDLGSVNFLSLKIYLAKGQIIFKQVKSYVYMLQ